LGTQETEQRIYSAREMEHTQYLVDRWFRRDPISSDRVPSESSAPGLETDSGESETDEDATDEDVDYRRLGMLILLDSTESSDLETDEVQTVDALEYVRVQYYVMHWDVDGVMHYFVNVILRVVMPPASLTGLNYNIALLGPGM
jgi:hypothetical protein